MLVIRFIPTGKNRWDIKVNGSKRGRLEKRRGAMVTVLTRPVPVAVLDGVSAFVGALNG